MLVAPLFGALLIVLAVRDVWSTLFRPGGNGSLNRLMSRGIWRIFRLLARHRPTLLVAAGPTALVAVVLTWVALLGIGWALVYWPFPTSDILTAYARDHRHLASD